VARSRVEGQAVSLGFEHLGAFDKSLACFDRRRGFLRQGIAKQICQHARKAEVAYEDDEQRALGGFESLCKISLNLIANKPQRAAGGIAKARHPQHIT
jgi:hypothetical protein